MNTATLPTSNIAATDRARRLYSYTNVHQPIPHPDAIDAAAIRRFHEDGFIAVENVLTQDEVAEYLKVIHETILADDGSLDVVHYEPGVDGSKLSPAERVLAVRKLFKFVDKVPGLARAAAHPVLMGIGQRLMEAELILLQDMALLKPPGGGAEKPWHQDTAYFRIKPLDSVLGTWIALDAATLDNGCMHAIPGTHKLGPQAHYHDRDCQLPDDRIDVSKDVAIPLKPGGAMFFSGLLWHGTPPNHSQSRRQAMQYHYCTRAAAEMSRDEVFAMFRDRGGYAGCQGWALKTPSRPMSERAV
ncbi:MAG TPA: phytanoyl-CoA dioxygenase family protein [Tepidisphaeraceae bacterium]|nr:phytanoyl-CoA dioxygenase family protein [Tepidisphaeraceae bacterium]